VAADRLPTPQSSIPRNFSRALARTFHDSLGGARESGEWLTFLSISLTNKGKPKGARREMDLAATGTFLA
jgi:hypothetical protein